MSAEPVDDVGTGPSAGALLAKARGKAKLSLADVAARTRIPQRHLQAIEAGEYSRLPSRTYAIGFSRTYARLLGMDERMVTEQVRLDLERADPLAPARPDRFEPGDPARLPSRRLAWLSALAVVVLLIGGFSFYRTYFSPGLGPAPLTERSPTGAAAAPASGARTSPVPASTAPAGPVVFTSLADGTWVKFYDSAGKRLFEGQMARGQSFTVPADAADPQIWTGRPNALAITVGGRPVAKLGEAEVIVRDVPVDARSLVARTVPPPARSTQIPMPPPSR